MLIGLGHRKRVGKDTVANILAEKYDFTVRSFAQPLKELADYMFAYKEGKNTLSEFQAKLAAWSSKYGLDKGSSVYQTLYYIDGMSLDLFVLEEGKPRKLLQYVGTDLIRNQYDKQFWVKATAKQFIGKNPRNIWTVITDVRFENEKQFIDQFGFAVKVDRKTDLKDVHESETALANAKWLYTIDNNSSLSDLERQVSELISTLLPELPSCQKMTDLSEIS